MTDLTFYMKPGCKTNTRQLAALEAAGLSVLVKDILSEPWTVESLGAFFKDRSISECFNPFAPSIKEGDVDPASFSKDEAIAVMMANPLLIRRPLVRTRWGRTIGFEIEALAEIGLAVGSLKPVSSACSSPARPCPDPMTEGGLNGGT